MGMKKGTQKEKKAKKDKPSASTEDTTREVPPPQPPLNPGEAMIPTSKLEELLRMANPNINWAATIAAMTQAPTVTTIGSTTPAASDQPKEEEVPPETADPPQNVAHTEERENPKLSETSTAEHEDSPVAPLNPTAISVYEKASTMVGNQEQEIEEEGEDKAEDGEEMAVSGEPQHEQEHITVDDEYLDELAKKQGLMTDEEFQMMLEGVQLLNQDTAVVAEGPDLPLPVGNEKEEPMVILQDTEIQPGGEVDTEERVKPPRSAKRKLDLGDGASDKAAQPLKEARVEEDAPTGQKEKPKADSPEQVPETPISELVRKAAAELPSPTTELEVMSEDEEPEAERKRLEKERKKEGEGTNEVEERGKEAKGCTNSRHHQRANSTSTTLSRRLQF